MSNVSANAREIVQKLWNASKSLQGGGVSYLEYVSELTYLLFLKMLEERKREDDIPANCRFSMLKQLDGEALLSGYRKALFDLGDPLNKAVTSPLIRAIYADAKTAITQPASLRSLFDVIDKVDWFSLDEDGIGDLYEGLLEKTVSERKSMAGQYFTPRALIDVMVRLVDPKPGEYIQDPAAGTGGFLIAAHTHIRRKTDDLFELGEKSGEQRKLYYRGLELIGNTRRLAIMNMMLHGIDAMLDLGDALGPDADGLGKADIVLTNPPFNKFPEPVRRQDFTITAGAKKGPLPFVEHIVRALKPGGRAAIVVPDNVLFEDGMGKRLRTWMMDICNVHTILRLPTGIFYAGGVKTNVIFLTRGATDAGNTKAVWVYDMRAGQPHYGKTRPLLRDDFATFEAAYGSASDGRVDEGETGRFRHFSRADISAREDNLDISWLRDADAGAEDALTEPDDLVEAIISHLKAAIGELEELRDESDRSVEVAHASKVAAE